jgi:hypothetical protein
MTTQNPFVDDPDRAEVFEVGYLRGFQDPTDDSVPPFAPDFIDAFNQGVDAGREDAINDPARRWVSKADLAEDSSDEALEHVAIEGIAHIMAHAFRQAAFGLIGLVITALSIQGDTPLHPLEDDFSQPFPESHDDTNVFFVACCPRTDHPQVAVGVTTEGYWAGTGQNDFGDALREALQHGHSEAIVARCSLTDNTCGPVWIAAQ